MHGKTPQRTDCQRFERKESDAVASTILSGKTGSQIVMCQGTFLIFGRFFGIESDVDNNTGVHKALNNKDFDEASPQIAGHQCAPAEPSPLEMARLDQNKLKEDASRGPRPTGLRQGWGGQP